MSIGGIRRDFPIVRHSETIPSTRQLLPSFAMLQVVAPAGDSPSVGLDAPALDISAVVRCKIDAATEHLRGLSSTKLSFVREELRVSMDGDPALVSLVLRATGR